MSEIFFSITYTADPNQTVRAEDVIVDYIESLGFSVGIKQAGSPRGIMFGSYDIQKWRNLNNKHRDSLHGIIDVRNLGTEATAIIFSKLRLYPVSLEAVTEAIEDFSVPMLTGSLRYTFNPAPFSDEGVLS